MKVKGISWNQNEEFAGKRKTHVKECKHKSGYENTLREMTKTFTTVDTQQSFLNKFSPETIRLLSDKVHHEWADQFDDKEDDLYATDDWEPSEESHGPPNKTEGGGELDLLVPLDLVEGGCVEVDLDQPQSGRGLLFP